MKENLKEIYTQRTDSCDMANSVEFTALMNQYKCAIMGYLLFLLIAFIVIVF